MRREDAKRKDYGLRFHVTSKIQTHTMFEFEGKTFSLSLFQKATLEEPTKPGDRDIRFDFVDRILPKEYRLTMIIFAVCQNLFSFETEISPTNERRGEGNICPWIH